MGGEGQSGKGREGGRDEIDSHIEREGRGEEVEGRLSDERDEDDDGSCQYGLNMEEIREGRREGDYDGISRLERESTETCSDMDTISMQLKQHETLSPFSVISHRSEQMRDQGEWRETEKKDTLARLSGKLTSNTRFIVM